MNKKSYRLLLIILAVFLLGAGCESKTTQAPSKTDNQASSTEIKIESKSNAATEGIVNKIKQQIKAGGSRLIKNVSSSPDGNTKNLSDTERKFIDDWLENNKLNIYGDSLDMIYAGGTPLFNEQTGETINRYEYLLKKFPELREIIKSQSAN